MQAAEMFSPDELLAVKTERGLTEERGHELVPVDLVDPAPHGSLPCSCKLLRSLYRRHGIIWKHVKAKTFFFPSLQPFLFFFFLPPNKNLTGGVATFFAERLIIKIPLSSKFFNFFFFI